MKQAEKLKSRKMNEGWTKMNDELMKNEWMKNDEGWMKDEWRMMKDEEWMMKDNDFKLLRGSVNTDRQTNRLTDEHTYVIVESLLRLKR